MKETRFQKAEICLATPKSHALFSQLRNDGFDGIEVTNWDVTEGFAADTRKVAEGCGLKIHSVMRAWTNLNTADEAAAEKDIDSIRMAIRAAAAYGAGVVLLVPCRVGEMPMPEPWDFRLEYNEKTLHLQKVVAGDNSQFQKYITAHNFATDMSKRYVERLIPEAEKCGVIIALENVWNNLWVTPQIFKAFVSSFQSKWIQAYFDIGNHTKYVKSEDWIRTLGSLIVRLHVKDFKLNPDGKDGQFADILTGSVNWSEVRKAIDEIGCAGWLTIEYQEGRLPNDEAIRRLDKIINLA